MGKKPKLDDLLKEVGEPEPPEPKPRKTTLRRDRRRAYRRKDGGDNLDVEMIRKWVPHLVATDFDRARSIELAFPSIEWKGRKSANLAFRLIQNPVFTDVMAAHLDTIDARLGNSERYVLDKLYRQAEANVFDYFDTDAAGKLVVKQLAELPAWQQKNIKKIRVSNKILERGADRRTIEQTVDIEIVDSFKPVALLGKNLGMFVEKIEMNLGVETANRLEEALERVKQKRLGHDQPGQDRASGKAH